MASVARAMPPRKVQAEVSEAVTMSVPRTRSATPATVRRWRSHVAVVVQARCGAAHAKASAAPSIRPTRWVSVPK